MTATVVERMPRASAAPTSSRSLGWLRERGMGASILVSAISTAFGVLLLTATAYIGAMLSADPYIGESDTLAFVVALLSALLLGVAIYVAAIVTANTFATVVAGRTRRIALLRLIGASARSQRVQIARQGLVVGLLGAGIGLVAGLALAAGGVWLAGSLLGLEDLEFSVLRPELVVPAVIVALTTWVSAWAGSRRVLSVTPLQALGGAVEKTHETIAARSGRNVTAAVLLILGAVLLGLGIAAGLVTPLGVIVAFAGGILSFTGLSLGATLIMPPVLRLVGRGFGHSATARLAAENALRYPERSSRMAIGVVMGVTLVTMFAVALESTKSVVAASGGGEIDSEFAAVMDSFAGIMMGLVAVSAVIAAVGLVNLLTIGVVQRKRELGLLRALGVSNAQVRRMVLLEAAHITIASTITGLVLGIVYGWAGAQSLLGSVPVPPLWLTPTFVPPAIPVWPVVAIVVATAVLTLVAAVTPTRLATRVAPVEALAE
ncbi:ABC transporter permease [Microbacterium sp. SLBN-146]|uniref:ABC transporter permease n=1 Tax=Microbacterium sp. SLBN-146 TaxID=2768457 RepID=UPI001151CE63|nr:ABC transporter permease [Microbacterium sp. SLBN-146]TQJ29785.1 putative ABC transport system permease protein [Microbacterium sp. SLBN-146]